MTKPDEKKPEPSDLVKQLQERIKRMAANATGIKDLDPDKKETL
jgi:hypothetical protein